LAPTRLKILPLDGVVHQSGVHAVGGIIPPASRLCWWRRGALTVEVKIAPQDID
jgi:hypothetical protein